MPNSVIFLAFANDKDAYLDTLKKERKGIRSKLFDADDKGYVKLHIEPEATIQDIFEAFARFRGRIRIFHYAGHANGTHLRLEDRNAHGQGLAELIQEENRVAQAEGESGIELVLLNGCATQGQVKALLEAGVKAVIATAVPVQDDKACDFALQFYQNLALGADVQEAYHRAAAWLQTLGHIQAANTKTHRFLEAMSVPQGADQSLEWGLYLRDASVKLDWKITAESTNIFDNPWLKKQQIKQQQEVNAYLVFPIFQAMSQYEYRDKFRPEKPKTNTELQLLKQKVMNAIGASFPYPVAVEIKKLFTPEMAEKSKARLERLVAVYARLSKYLAYVLLSQIWDEKYQHKISLSEEFDANLQTFRHLTLADYQQFNYARLANALLNVMKDNGIEPFIAEILDAKSREFILLQEDFRAAYHFLEEIKQQLLEGRLSEAQAVELCDNTEYSLGVMLQKCAFLVAYQLVSVRDIYVQKFRRQNPDAFFNHQMTILLGDIIPAGDRYETCYENYSVLLIRQQRENTRLGSFLNLSPFLTDQNAFVDTGKLQISKLLLFAYQDEAKTFFYEHIGTQSGMFVPHTPPNTEIKSNKKSAASESKELDLGELAGMDFGEPAPTSLPEEEDNALDLYSQLQRQWRLFEEDFTPRVI